MQTSGRITSRALKVLLNSSGRETAVSVTVLVIRSFLPLVGVLLIRFYVDRLTGSPGSEPLSAPGAGPLSAPGTVAGLIIAMSLTLLVDELLSYAGQYFARRQSFLVEGHISSLIHNHATGLGMRLFDACPCGYRT